MILDSQVSASFDRLDPSDIGQARQLDELSTSGRKLNSRETWCCAWSPDNEYFAWSLGRGIIQLLPWDSFCNSLITVPNDDLNEPHSPEAVIRDIPWKFSERGNNKSKSDDENDTIRCLKRHRLDCKDNVWSMAFSSCCRDDLKQYRRFNMHPLVILATGLMKGKIKLWDVYAGTLLMELLDHKDVVRGLDFSPTGLKLVSGSNDGTLKFWDVSKDGNMYRTLKNPNALVMDCKWSPTGKHIAAVGTMKCVIISDVDNLHADRKLIGHGHSISSCQFTPDGAILASASLDTRVIFWDVVSGNIIKQLFHLHPPPRPIFAGGVNGHSVRKLAFSSDGLSLRTVADDGYLRVWDLLDTTNPVAIAHTKNPLCCAGSHRSGAIAVGSQDGSVRFYEVARKVAPLQHLCRLSVRWRLSSDKVDQLQYPPLLKEYLKYNIM